MKVGVDADMSPFRQTLRAELDAVRRQGATIPVGAGGGGGGNVVPPGAASATVHPGASPTSQAVAQQGAAAGAAAANRAAMVPLAAAQAAIQAATGSFTGAGGMVGPMTGGFGVGPLNAPGGGPQQASPPEPPPNPTASQWWRYLGGADDRRSPTTDEKRERRQRMQFLTGAYIGNAAGRLLENEMNYGTATRLAGSDPDALISAELKYRQGVADAFPVAGRLGVAINDLFTGGDEPIQRTLRDAGRQNEFTAQMRRTGGLTLRLRQAGALAGLRGAEQARESIRIQFDRTMEDVRDERSTAAQATADKFRHQRDELDVWMQQTPISQGGTEEEYNRRYQAIGQAETDEVRRRAMRFGSALEDIAKVRNRGLRDIDRNITLDVFRTQGATAASRLRTQNRPFEAAVSERMTNLAAELFTADPETRGSVAGRGLQDMAESFVDFARDFGHQQRQMTAQQRVSQKLLERDPLGARIAGIEGERDEALTAANQLPWGFRQIRQFAIRRGARQDINLVNQQDDDARELRLQSLSNRREHYDLLAQGKPFTAQVTDVKRSMQEDINEMTQSKRYSAEEIKGRIRLAISQEEALTHDFRRRMNAGFGMESAAFSMGPGVTPGNNQEPVVNAIKEATKIIQDLKAALTGS